MNNMAYYINPSSSHGKLNVTCAGNIIEDKELKFLPMFATPVLETQGKAWSLKL